MFHELKLIQIEQRADKSDHILLQYMDKKPRLFIRLKYRLSVQYIIN
jgi:hypothetical protein